MPKKAPPNSFYFFMKELQEQYASNGEFIPLPDISPLAGPLWQELNKTQRKPYEQKAAEAKSELKRNKLTNDGEAIDLVQKRKKEEEDFKHGMLEEIAETVKNAGAMIDTVNFNLIHINIFCQVTASQKYYPAEIAVARFNLQKGVAEESAVYHSFCKPGELPLGYAFAVQQTASEAHQISYPDDGDCNMKSIFKSIIQFLTSNSAEENDLPPLYAFGKNMPVCTDVMRTLCEDFCCNKNLIRVYALEHLFYNLRNSICLLSEADLAFPTVSSATLELEKDVYDYTKHISCDFHEGSDVPNHCSKSTVTRWAYIICDHCCPSWNIKLIPGQHVPLRAQLNVVSSHTTNSTASCSSSVKSLCKNPCPSIGHHNYTKENWRVRSVTTPNLQNSEADDSASSVTVTNLSTRMSDLTLVDCEGLDEEKLGPGSYGTNEVLGRELTFVTSSQESGRISAASSTNDLTSQASTSTGSTCKLRRPYSKSAAFNYSLPTYSDEAIAELCKDYWK